ncbi:MAG: 3-isopropylmalate dehydrogenase [Dehalococcoidia bacterium]|nr:MAG: 3-isopropylmalate dehydrogenase [Dehalococcoidia bacterium]
MKFRIAQLSGDGIGPEVVAQAVKVLEAVGSIFGHEFEVKSGLIGGIAIDKTGSAMPEETLKLAKSSDAVLFGAVGDPKFDDPKIKERPENGLLAVRKGLKLFANLRPVKVYDELADGTVFKPEVIKGADFIFVRELTGGLYFGKPKKRWETSTGRKGVDSMYYTEQEIERIVRAGFELARGRRKKLTSVDKANVLESSRLWRQVTLEVSKDYPEVLLEHMLVDTCAMRIILTPRDFDVLVTENTFGDILTDEASMLAGSMGMLPSASLAGIPAKGKRIFGLYEPIHGSAPTIAGKDIANPIATVLSLAMLLRYSLNLENEAKAVEKAVSAVLKAGYRTCDIIGTSKKQVGTSEMGRLIVKELKGQK